MATKTTSRSVRKKQVVPKTVEPPLKKANLPELYTVLLFLVMAIVAMIRFRLAGTPFERDEGEYAYIGGQILEGTAPYISAYNMKLPGTYFMYAMLMLIFGKTYFGIHLGLILVNLATTWLFYAGFRKLFNSPIAFFASSVYILFSLSHEVLGFAAHATHFINLFVAVAIFLLGTYQVNNNSRYVFYFGLALGLAFLMKQQAVYFLLFGGFYILFQQLMKEPKVKPLIKSGAAYAAGVFLPYLVTAGYLFISGAFEKFWFWTVEYASKYASGLEFEHGKTALLYSFKPIADEYIFIWVLAGAGLVFLFLSSFTKLQKLFVLCFFVFAFLSITPGFYFRQHYFITLFPAIGLLAGIALYGLTTYTRKWFRVPGFALISVAILVYSAGSAFSNSKEYYFKLEPQEIVNNVYRGNPFGESEEVANYLKENSLSSDKIAILGSEPQILFYAGRKSATGYLYTYSLMEDQPFNKKMQNEMIKEIEAAAPRYIVFCKINFSWLRRPESPSDIFDWFNQYIQQYNLIGVTDIPGNAPSISVWGQNALTYSPQSQNNLLIFERK